MAKHSPVPGKSLPQAGDSLRNAAEDLIFDRFFAWAFLAIALGMVAAVELGLRWLGSPMSPWIWALAAAVLGALAIKRWFGIKSDLHNLVLGMRGERHVGQILEELRTLGYSVFHDIPGEGCNVDHALIGPGGVFAIETKTRSLPEGRKAKIVYDGSRIFVDGFEPDRDPVAQAEAAARQLQRLFKDKTGRDISVRPVVVFPGRFVERQPRGVRVWVLNPKGLKGFLQNEPAKLSNEDVALYVDCLRSHLSLE